MYYKKNVQAGKDRDWHPVLLCRTSSLYLNISMSNIGEYFFGENTDKTATTSQECETDYSNLINLYIPYYKQLPEDLKKKFLQRTWHFRNIKSFHCVGMTEQAEIPILISAAAVQLTLGLEKYELSFFKDIYITPDAYKAEGKEEIFIGHVSPTGIYISWKYFLQGYNDATDNVNVAIHELAHALAHENFMDEAGVDADFRTDFAKFSEVSGPVLARTLTRGNSYLRPYAFTNFQEFWAVSVEAFFENPAALKKNLPELYASLCNVLNQDLLTTSIILPHSD